MGVHDGAVIGGVSQTALDVARANPDCERIRAAVPTTFADSRTMGDWGDEVMNRHRDCCRLRSWWDPKARRYRWYRFMSKMVTFDYRGLRIQADVVETDTGSQRVDEWTAYVIEEPMRAPPLEIPLAVWEILDSCSGFRDGMQQLAVEEAR